MRVFQNPIKNWGLVTIVKITCTVYISHISRRVVDSLVVAVFIGSLGLLLSFAHKRNPRIVLQYLP
jgi:hypothetical protein